MTPAQWARSVAAAQEQNQVLTGQIEEVRTTTDSYPGTRTGMVFSLPSNARTSWADVVGFRANTSEVVHEAVLVSLPDAGDDRAGLYVEAQRVTTVKSDSLVVHPITIALNGIISSGDRPLLVEEARLIATSLLTAVDAVAAPTRVLNDTTPAVSDENTYASNGYRDREALMHQPNADGNSVAATVRLMARTEALELAKQLQDQARRIEQRLVRAEPHVGSVAVNEVAC